MDDLIEFIDNARQDANFHRDEGRDDEAVVTLSVAQCDMLGSFFFTAYGAIMTGKGVNAIADKLALLSAAFVGSDDG